MIKKYMATVTFFDGDAILSRTFFVDKKSSEIEVVLTQKAREILDSDAPEAPEGGTYVVVTDDMTSFVFWYSRDFVEKGYEYDPVEKQNTII